jgi:hypothetical protein
VKEEWIMMKILYEELREKGKEVKDEAAGGSRYFEAVKIIRMAENLARKEGCLALDPDPECGKTASMIPAENPFMDVLRFIADGKEAVHIMDIMLMKYYAQDLKGTDGIIFLMYIVGGLSIQAGEAPDVLLEKLEAMIPAKFYEEYKECFDKEEAIHQKTYEETMKEKIQKLCEREDVSLDENNLYLADAFLDRIFEMASDSDMEKILQEIDNRNLCMALKHMGGKASRKVFHCIPEKLSYTIMEDMEYLGPVRIADVEEAKKLILAKIVKLLRQNKLNPEHFEMLMLVMNGGDYS